MTKMNISILIDAHHVDGDLSDYEATALSSKLLHLFLLLWDQL